MTDAPTDKLQDYIDTCRLEAEARIDEVADTLDDTIIGYVHSGEYGLKKFRPWAALTPAEYFQRLLKSYVMEAIFLVVMTSAFFTATFYEPDASVRHTSQAVFGVMLLLFATVVFLDFRLHYGWFKAYGFVFKHCDEIRENAVRTVGIGEKYVYSASTKPNRERVLRPYLVVEYDSYSEISNIELTSSDGRNELSIAGTRLGLDIIQDPVFDDFEDAVVEVRSRMTPKAET